MYDEMRSTVHSHSFCPGIFVVLVATLCCFTLTACLTSTYGGSPKPDPFKPNTYNIKVYQNRFSGLSETSEQASEESKEFCGPNKYTAFRIA